MIVRTGLRRAGTHRRKGLISLFVLTKRALALFAKDPTATLVKTRLVPPLSYAEAASLAAAFIEDASIAVDDVARRVDAKPCLFFDPPSAIDAIRPLPW